MARQEKKPPSKKDKDHLQLDHEWIANLAKGVIEQLQENILKIEDPVHGYSYELKLRLFKNEENLACRMAEGYSSLLEQLQKA